MKNRLSLYSVMRTKTSRGGMKARHKSQPVSLTNRLAADSTYASARRQPSLPKLKFLERPFPEGGEQ
jgi:hypothetical protein